MHATYIMSSQIHNFVHESRHIPVFKDAKTGKLTFLTCGRPDLDAAIEKVKANVHITREEGKKTKVYSCGVGGYQYHKQLEEGLGIE